MENSRYKVELWTEEVEKKCNESKLLQFRGSDKDVLRITNAQYEEIFSYLTKGRVLQILNEKDEDSQEKYYGNSTEFKGLTTSKVKEQKEILDRLIEKNETSLKEYGEISSFISFGILDYVDIDKKHIVKSAPLVFLPIKIEKTEDGNYQISAVNEEIYLNDTLISYVRKSRKIDISYPLNPTFSIIEYLTYIAPKVHMFHWSVNNGVFLSDFDLFSQKYLEDIIQNQEQISDIPLIKSVSYYNSEFFSFNQPKGTKLSKKLLSLLALDNDEYHIMQKVADRESLFIRTDSLSNRAHLIQNIISGFLLNNKKVLVVYNEREQKEQLLPALDESLKPYYVDLDEVSIDKNVFLDRLTTYESYHLQKNLFDPLSMQEILNQYYEVRNEFKKTINSLRKKNRPFGLSLAMAIENYYHLEENMLNIEIPHIAEMTPQKLEEYLSNIREFEHALIALKCNYKDHPFYGFEKSTMMQEEYLPLKNSFTLLSEELKKFMSSLKKFHEKYEFPYANNLKLAKALLNLLSIGDSYRLYPQEWFEELDWNEEITKVVRIQKKQKKINQLKDVLISEYGEKIFDIPQELLLQAASEKGLSKKKMREAVTYFSNDNKTTIEEILKAKRQLDAFHKLQEQCQQEKESLPLSIQDYFKEKELSVDSIHPIMECIKTYKISKAYFLQNRLPLSLKNMDQLKDESKYKDIMNERVKLQVLFNHVLENTNIVQPYFNTQYISFVTMPFEEYQWKADRIAKDFISINQYLDFYVALYRINRIIPSLGTNLLKIENYSLYESMFLKRFYYDYAKYLMNSLRKETYSDEFVFGSVETYEKSEQNRKLLFDSFMRNYYLEYLQSNISNLRKYEWAYIQETKENKGIRPLAKITSLAHESIYHMMPCFLIPLKHVAKLLSSEQYHFDAVIVLSDRKMKTKETLSALVRADQTIVFDGQYLIRGPKTDYIDPSQTEDFVSASKRCFDNVEYTAKSYEIVPLRLNTKDASFKKYIIKFLRNEGFEIAEDIALKEGMVDMIARMPLKKGYTAIIIDSLPYQSIESAELTFQEEERILKNRGYNVLRVFAFAFFLNEEKAKKELIQKLIENSSKMVERKKKLVKKKLTDVLFEPYQTPAEIYVAYKNKSDVSRKDLFLAILKRTAPCKKQEFLSLFQMDGVAIISSLIAEEKIYEKEDFLYVYDEEITFRSSKEKLRKIEDVSGAEISNGILRIVEALKKVSEDQIIKMILLTLGYQKMNAKTYQTINAFILDLVRNKSLYLNDGMVSKEPFQEENH